MKRVVTPESRDVREDAFAAGFVVRPVGALLFARFGDLIGRNSIFLLTLITEEAQDGLSAMMTCAHGDS